MTEQQRSGTHVSFTGTNSGQFVAGNDNTVSYRKTSSSAPVTRTDLAELHEAVAAIRRRLDGDPAATAEVDPTTAARARDKLTELEEAVTADQPDLPAMEHIRNWFARHLPKLAGMVASVVIHPVVGRLAEAAGESVAAEFRRRFGGDT